MPNFSKTNTYANTNANTYKNSEAKDKAKPPFVISIIATLTITALFFTGTFNQAYANSTLKEISSSKANNALSIDALHLEHQQALQLDIDSPHKGRIAHEKIAQQLASFIGDPTLDQADLLYDIGTSWFQAGRYGKSILWLRRAENIAPSNAVALHNLAQARRKRLDQLPDNFAPPWINTLHSTTKHPIWLTLCWLGYCLFWFVIWQYFTHGSIKRTGVINKNVFLALALISVAGASQLCRFYLIPLQSEAVITSQEVVSRKGPGLIFSPAFTSPLHAGAELIVLRHDGKWSEVKLTNNHICWLPTRAVTLI